MNVIFRKYPVRTSVSLTKYRSNKYEYYGKEKRVPAGLKHMCFSSDLY